MRQARFFVFLSTLLWLFASLTSTSFALRAGAAKVDITPPIGTPLAGFGARLGAPSKGIYDPIYARALYLDDGKTDWLMVVTDTVLFMGPMVQDVEKRLRTKPTLLTTAATHTHAGPGHILKEPGVFLGAGVFNRKTYDKVVAGITQAMEQAVRRARPARIAFAKGQAGLSHNRRFEGGKKDSEVGIMRVDDEKGKVIAVLYNFAAHPTIVGDNYFSADYPGYANQVIEQVYPEATALFFNGAQGDQAPSSPCGGDDQARARCTGYALGGEVLDRVQGAAPVEKPVIRFHEQQVLLNPQMNYAAKVQAITIGPALFLTIPGEAYVEIGLHWKVEARKRGYDPVFVFGLANDTIGYIVYPEEVYHMHVYETLLSLFGARLGPFFYDLGPYLLQKLPRG